MKTENFVYVTYIATTPLKLWAALVDEDTMAQYWTNPVADDSAHINVSDWKTGSRWEHQRADETRTVDIVGKVIESTPPHRLILSWARPADVDDESKHSRVTFNMEPYDDILVCFTVTHEDLDPGMFTGVSDGWPKVLSNLKTLLETGRVLSRSVQRVAGSGGNN